MPQALQRARMQEISCSHIYTGQSNPESLVAGSHSNLGPKPFQASRVLGDETVPNPDGTGRLYGVCSESV